MSLETLFSIYLLILLAIKVCRSCDVLAVCFYYSTSKSAKIIFIEIL